MIYFLFFLNHYLSQNDNTPKIFRLLRAYLKGRGRNCSVFINYNALEKHFFEPAQQ